MPGVQLLEAGTKGLRMGFLQIRQSALQIAEPGLPRIELLLETLLQKTLDEPTHLQIGGKQLRPVRRRRNLFDGPHLPQHPQTLADRAFAQRPEMGSNPNGCGLGKAAKWEDWAGRYQRLFKFRADGRVTVL